MKEHEISMNKAAALETLTSLYASEMDRVDVMIGERMQSRNASRIPDITTHLTQAGGKRIRPLLTVATASLCGYDGDHHIKLATAIEFIHTATLLHDDVVDESEKRRGKPTANRLWDNKSSILVGDYLFSRAFQLMVETDNLKVLGLLADASAVIAEGEVLQLQTARNIATSEATYFKVIEGKTASLFAAACESGALITSHGDHAATALREYGLKLGLAFQIADDVLDYVAEDAFGKVVGNDFSECKLTLPILRAIARADEEELKFWQRTIARAEQGEGDFDRALEIINKYDGLETSKKTALSLSNQAKAALEHFEPSTTRELLSDLADLVVNRLV